MIGEKIQCEREGCEEWFTKRTHNQRYHDSECTRLATNAHIMSKYYEEQARKNGTPRYCRDCGSRLSRYNPDTICGSCEIKDQTIRNLSVANMLSDMSS